jgi:hypothetical protein
MHGGKLEKLGGLERFHLMDQAGTNVHALTSFEYQFFDGRFLCLDDSQLKPAGK